MHPAHQLFGAKWLLAKTLEVFGELLLIEIEQIVHSLFDLNFDD